MRRRRSLAGASDRRSECRSGLAGGRRLSYLYLTGDGRSLNVGRPQVLGVSYWGVDVAIEGKSPGDLVRLALAGSGLELDGRRYSVPDLTAVARAMRPNCTLVITNSEGKATTDLIALIEAAPGRVIIS